MDKKQGNSGNIFLIGFMGCGKSTVAKELHRNYGMRLIEMDEALARQEGMSIADIFREKGEPYFRKIETELLENMQKISGTVVSCGGGAAMRQENVDCMRRSGKIVLLTAEPETILQRVKNSDSRPLLRGRKNEAAIRELIEERRPAYEKAADVVIRTDGKEIDTICRELLEKNQFVIPSFSSHSRTKRSQA